MDIRTLREFNTLVMYGSYTPAAKALYLSQSSLSRHIAALEKEVGQKLLFDTHPLTPTKAGEAVIKQTTEIVSAYESMMVTLGGLSRTKPELVRIQNRMHLESLYSGIFKAISLVEKEHPNVTFDFVKTERVYTPEEALRAEKADITFLFGIEREPSSSKRFLKDGIDYIPMSHFSGELCFGIKRTSPLLAAGRKLSFSDFADTRFFAPAERHIAPFLDNVREICAIEGVHPKIETVATDNYLDFYSRVPDDGVVFVTRLGEGKHTSLDCCIKTNLATIRPETLHGPYYINAALMARDGARTEAFNQFLDIVEGIETNNLNESDEKREEEFMAPAPHAAVA